MQLLSYGDLSICEIALIMLIKGVDPNTELGKQICECIGKIDAMIKQVRIDLENKPEHS